MAWTVTIHGETFNDTDFQPFTYPINFPRIFQAVADGFSAIEETVSGVYGVSILDYYDAADGIDYAITLRRALAAGEKAISFPAGNFQFRSQDPIGVGYAVHFRDKTGVLIRGAAGGGTTITIGSSANVGAFNFASCTDCEIADLVIDCARQNQTTTSNVHGVRGGDLTRCKIRRVTIKDSLGYGLGLQAGAFAYNLFEDITVTSSGNDGVDVKNNASGNIGNIFTRLRVGDWRRLNPADAKAAFDTRGGVRITDSTFYLTEVSGYATNTPFLRFRPDEQALLTFVSSSGTIPINSYFVGASSGASGIARASTNASSATIIVAGVDGIFSPGERLLFDSGASATFSSATYTVTTGGRDPLAINCRAYGPTGNVSTGVGFVTSQNGSMFVNCVARNVRDGFKTSGSTSFVTIDNCYAQFCNTGFYLEADDVRISNCTSEESASEGVYVFGQRNVFNGFRGFRDNVGFRRQGTASNTTLINVSFTSSSTEFAGSYTAGTFSAFDVPGRTNAFEFNGNTVIGASTSRVGFFGENGDTQQIVRGVNFTRGQRGLFNALVAHDLFTSSMQDGIVTGSPEGVVLGNPGDIANRTDMGGHLYYKTHGSSVATNGGTANGWVPFIRGIAPGTLIAPNFLDPRLTFSRTQTSSLSEVLGPDGATYREYEANQPRFAGRTGRLQFEGARTNLLSNPRGIGIVAGAAPTGWTLRGSQNGSSRTYSSSTMAGMPSVIIAQSGTTTAALNIRYTLSSATAVSPNTPYTASVIARLAGGSLSGLSNFQLVADWLDSGGTAIGSTGIFVEMLSTISTVASRFSGTLTSPASAASVAVGLRYVTASSGVVLNSSIEVAGQQLEPTSILSTPVLPVENTEGLAARGTDSLFASTEIFDVASNGACTVVGSFLLPTTSVSASDAQTLFDINDGSTSNRYMVRNDPGSNNLLLYRTTTGAGSSVSLGAITAGVLFRVAMTVDGAGNAAASLNGGTVQSVSGGPTSGLRVFRIGASASSFNPMFGQIQSLRFLNYSVTNAELAPLLANIG